MVIESSHSSREDVDTMGKIPTKHHTYFPLPDAVYFYDNNHPVVSVFPYNRSNDVRTWQRNFAIKRTCWAISRHGFCSSGYRRFGRWISKTMREVEQMQQMQNAPQRF
jgi:hypothetical protein